MTSKWTSRLIITLTLAFLIGPFVIIIMAGLSVGDFLKFPPDGLSLKWYFKVFTVESFRASFALSMFLVVFGTLMALVLGIPAAYAISRYKIPYGEHREYVIEAAIGQIKAFAPATWPVYELGAQVAFDLPQATSLSLPRSKTNGT